jgi:hypothetical protein
VDKTYYEPTDRGHEKHIRKFMEWLKSPAPAEPTPPEGPNDPR